MNYSANHIAKLESARTNPSFDLLIKIAKALNIQIKDLFDFEDLNTIEYMKQDLLKTIKSADKKIIVLLYKFKKSLFQDRLKISQYQLEDARLPLLLILQFLAILG